MLTPKTYLSALFSQAQWWWPFIHLWMSWVYATVMPWPGDLPHPLLFSSWWPQLLTPYPNRTSTKEECRSVASPPCDMLLPLHLFQTPFVSLCLLQGTGVLILARAVIRVFRGAVSWLQAVKHAGAGANRQAELGQASALCQIREEEMSDSSSWVCLKC